MTPEGKSQSGTTGKAETFSVEDRLSSMLRKDIPSVAKTKELSHEEQLQKDAIISRYGTVFEGDSDEAASDDEYDGGGGDEDDLGLFKNMNVKSVMQAEKQRRDKMKDDSEKKKARDQQNREDQKRKTDERKEKEKKRTQKQERRTR